MLILDEPTVGIDPKEIIETRQLIRGLAEKHTVLLSSHILAEVSTVCRRVIIIHEGAIAADAATADLADSLEDAPRFEVEIVGPRKRVHAALQAVEGMTRVDVLDVAGSATFRLETEPGKDLRSSVSALIVDNGWELLRLQPVAMTLDEIFVQITSRDRAEDA